MKDPFPPARQAGIVAMAATHNFFTLREGATRLLPALCSMTLDPEKMVRDQVSDKQTLNIIFSMKNY
jgi:SCY1-like protein 1